MSLNMKIFGSRLSAMFLAVACSAALGACTGEIEDEGTVAPATPEANAPATDEDAEARAGWKKANLTNFTSYPDPDSEECREYNGCTWAGQFAFVNGKKSENWVRNHNIVAVHERDANRYKLKTLRLKKGGDEIDVKVYDECSDSDCHGCCTRNARSTGFLIDIESYTMDRFGHGDGTVQWKCLDCN
jgi:hypothetical protein